MNEIGGHSQGSGPTWRVGRRHASRLYGLMPVPNIIRCTAAA